MDPNTLFFFFFLNVTKYIYSVTVLKYNLAVALLDISEGNIVVLVQLSYFSC